MAITLDRFWMLEGKPFQKGSYQDSDFTERQLELLRRYKVASEPVEPLQTDSKPDSGVLADNPTSTPYEPENVTKGALKLIQGNSLGEVEVELIRKSVEGEDGRISQSDVEAYLADKANA